MTTTIKYPKKIIPQRYFNELKREGNTVPRDEKTGCGMPFIVGKNYTIATKGSNETILARCTQDCPYHLRTIN